MASPCSRAVAITLLTLSQPTAAASVTGCGSQGCGALETEGADPKAAEFDTYSRSFSRNYEHNSKEYWLRRGLFEQRTTAVNTHNARLDRSWEAVAGPFADRTETERASMRGWRHLGGPASGGAELPASIASERELLRPTAGNATLPNKFDWMHLRVAHTVPDQGQCGSCWAVASKSVLDAHYEIHIAGKDGPLRNFSAQQIVSCIPNPRSCGGTGGCKGSTVELAFDWVLHNGCADENHVPYHAQDLSLGVAKCNESKILSLPSGKGLYGAGSSHLAAPEQVTTPAMGGNSFGMHGYHMLERNKEEPLMQALYQHGPVATSTSAATWFEYSSGIFDDCKKDTIVDHAVTLFGYGEDRVKAKPLMPVLASGGKAPKGFEAPVKKYWLIRNSWGKQWGEKGFIRLLRYGTADQHCGKDSDNAEGTGCKGDPQTVEVCGMCGFLYDSVVPHFAKPGEATPKQSVLEMDAGGKLLRREA